MSRADGEWMPVVRGDLGSWRVVVQRRPLTREGVVRTYQRLAPSWAARRAAWGFDEAYAHLLGRTLGDRVARALAAGPIVDVGCGDGGLSAACVRVHGPRDVHLVDPASAMLGEAVRRLDALGCVARAHVGHAEALPLPTGSAGLVLAGHVFEHLADPVPALREARRVLAPGGLVVVVATRCAVVGRWLQLRWRLRCHEASDADHALAAAGLEGTVAELVGPWRLRRASLAWVGEPALPWDGPS